MHLVRRIAVIVAAVGFLLCCGTVLLFNHPKFGWQLLSIPTGSMRPAIVPGSLVLVHRVPDQTLKVGDVITYTNPLTMRSTLTHRIIRVYKIDGKIPAYITKGDANPSPDPPVVAGLVQGRELMHMPHAGALLMWAKTWVGIAILVYLPALIIIAEETRRMADYLRAMRPYRLEGAFDGDDYIEPAWLLLWRKPAAVMGAVMFVFALALLGQQASWADTIFYSNNAVIGVNNLQAAVTTPPPKCPAALSCEPK